MGWKVTEGNMKSALNRKFSFNFCYSSIKSIAFMLSIFLSSWDNQKLILFSCVCLPLYLCYLLITMHTFEISKIIAKSKITIESEHIIVGIFVSTNKNKWGAWEINREGSKVVVFYVSIYSIQHMPDVLWVGIETCEKKVYQLETIRRSEASSQKEFYKHPPGTKQQKKTQRDHHKHSINIKSRAGA